MRQLQFQILLLRHQLLHHIRQLLNLLVLHGVVLRQLRWCLLNDRHRRLSQQVLKLIMPNNRSISLALSPLRLCLRHLRRFRFLLGLRLSFLLRRHKRRLEASYLELLLPIHLILLSLDPLFHLPVFDLFPSLLLLLLPLLGLPLFVDLLLELLLHLDLPLALELGGVDVLVGQGGRVIPSWLNLLLRWGWLLSRCDLLLLGVLLSWPW